MITVRLFLINLCRRRSRLTRVQSQCNALSLPWERVPAVDGLSLSSSIVKNFDLTTLRPLKRGEIGCYLSHQKAWEKAMSGPRAECYWFLEDDVEFVASSGTIRKQVEQAAELAECWDLIYTSGIDSTNSFFEVCDPNHIDGVSDTKCEEVHSLNARAVRPQLGAYSYILSPSGLRNCIDGFFVPLNPVDVQFSQISPPLRKYLLDIKLTKHGIDGISDTRIE